MLQAVNTDFFKTHLSLKLTILGVKIQYFVNKFGH